MPVARPTRSEDLVAHYLTVDPALEDAERGHRQSGRPERAVGVPPLPKDDRGTGIGPVPGVFCRSNESPAHHGLKLRAAPPDLRRQVLDVDRSTGVYLEEWSRKVEG